jgi:hypothetical protein
MIPSIIQAVQAAFGKSSGDPALGATKLATAVEMTKTVAETLAKSGRINGVPDISTITTMVETAVQQLKAADTGASVPGTAVLPTVLSGATVIIIRGT